MNKLIIIALIAEREVDFYLKIADKITADSNVYRVCFVSFFQPGNEKIIRGGYKVYDLYSNLKKELVDNIDYTELHKLALHEKVTFGENDCFLEDKFVQYICGIDRILNSICGLEKIHVDDIVVMQELGGFIAPIALYLNCKKNNIDHYFFEPSFFRGMFFIVKNRLDAVKNIDDNILSEIKGEKNFIDMYDGLKDVMTPIIPSKDKHHFIEMGLSKLLNKRNVCRLYSKIKEKYISRKKQEYQYIFRYSKKYLFMMIAKYISSVFTYTRKLPEKYVYFPFHVQLDYSLTIRNPEYFDQLSLVQYIYNTLPSGVCLVVKEHPASVGGFGWKSLMKLYKDNLYLKIINPSVSNKTIIEKSLAVITVNSKVGAESILLGKPVIALGDSFYSGSKLVKKIDSRADISKVLADLLSCKMEKNNSDKEIKEMFFKVYNESYYGDLYNMDSDNIEKFSNSIMLKINEDKRV